MIRKIVLLLFLPPPVIVRLPRVRDEARKIADLLSGARDEGYAWGDMAILCRANWVCDECAKALAARRMPHAVRRGSGTFDPLADTIKVMTMHASKGLEFPVVALPGVGLMPGENMNRTEEARLFYVAATRATHKLFVTVSGDGEFGNALSPAQ